MEIDELPPRILSKINLIENSTTGLGMSLNLAKLFQELKKEVKDSKRLANTYMKLFSQHVERMEGVRQLKMQAYDWIEQRLVDFKKIDRKHRGITKSTLRNIEIILKGEGPLPFALTFDGLDNLTFGRTPLYEILLQLLYGAIDIFASWGVFEELEQFAEFEIVGRELQVQRELDLLLDKIERCEISPSGESGLLLAKMLGHGFVKAGVCPGDPRYALSKRYEVEHGRIRFEKPLPKFIRELKNFENRQLRLEELDTDPVALLNDLLFYVQVGEMIGEYKECWVENGSFLNDESPNFSGCSLMEIDVHYENQFLKHFAWKLSKDKNFTLLHDEIMRLVNRFLLHLQDRSQKLDPGDVRSQNSLDDEEFAYDKIKAHLEKMSATKRSKFSNEDAKTYIVDKANKIGRHFNRKATARACKSLRNEMTWITKPGPKSN